MWITKIWPLDLSLAYNLSDDFLERFISTSVVNCNNGNDFEWCLEILSEEPVSIKDFKLPSTAHFSCSKLPEQDWLAKCFENFKPIIVDQFYIYASHTNLNLNMTKKYICMQINAANAFGSGEHPTTQGCLKAISLFFDPRKYTTALDLGCGSCILSMALAKLGCKKVFAYDNDRDAVEVARTNTEINHVEKFISTLHNEDVEFNVRQYDFIVSNILASPLIELSKDVYHSLKKNGILIISGFTNEQSNVIDSYTKLGLAVIKKIEISNWVTAVFKK